MRTLLCSMGRTPARVVTVLLLSMLLLGPAARALEPGDVAIIGYQSDDPDMLAFVVLNEVPAGTAIRFTDSGWYASGGFRANEGGIQYTAATTLSPGTVVTGSNPFTSGQWSVQSSGLGSGGFLLSASGDQVLVFQGAAESPAFIYAINADSAGWSDATSSNTTALPATLEDGVTAVNIGSPERDNGYYDGPTTGTADDLLLAISDAANWVVSDSQQSWPAWSFTVLGGGPPAITGVWMSDASFEHGATGEVLVELNETPPVGTPAVVSVASGAFDVSPVTITIVNPNLSGLTFVTMTHSGVWTTDASAVSGCTGTATSSAFTVGTAASIPVAYAGPDRTVVLSGTAVVELMLDATATDADGFDGLSYEWTPATGPGIVTWAGRTGVVIDSADPSEARVTIDQTGVYTFDLTVTDPTMLFDTDTVVITVIGNGGGDEYDAPADYYDPARPGGAWYTGPSLKTALHNIIDDHVYRSYDAARNAFQLLDRDPNNPDHIVLVYDGASVPKAWDSGVTYNREHLWPDSLNPNPNDLFNIKPCTPSLNFARGNKPYGVGSGEWDADQGHNDRGDCARAIFYMATRYTNLTIVTGTPGSGQMGDLTDLLAWHYADPVCDFERRRNHLLFDAVDNPGYYQGNRNPFIDHPELVWSIWGGVPNNSTLYIGASPAPDGASTLEVDLGPVIVGGALPAPQSITLHKTGTHPTTYAVNPIGDGICSVAGSRFAFADGTQSRTLSVGLSSSTATPGLCSGTVVVDNTDLTSSGLGHGADDGNDIVTVYLPVLAHADASFIATGDENTQTIAFGSVPAGSGLHTAPVSICNLETVPGFTAALDLDAIAPAGDTDIFPADLAPLTALPAGQCALFEVSFDADHASGDYAATYTLSVSDEDLAGALPGAPLVLTITGTISPAGCAGDMNCDGVVNYADIDLFVAALGCVGGDPSCWPSECPWLNADCNGDAGVTYADIDPFVGRIGATCP